MGKEYLTFWGLRFAFLTLLVNGLLGTKALAQVNPHEVINRECQVCHTTQSWNVVQFDHDSTTFPLEGRHVNLDCVDCHTLKNFDKVGKECVDCHLDVHQDKLGKRCNSCHTSQNWMVLDPLEAHAHTTFPLIGVHANLDCKSCHVGEIQGEFSFLRSECHSCHESDFRNAQNPVHSELGFGLRCEECHTMLNWQPANFEKHDLFFPIFSGEHDGEWRSCNDCHIETGNFQVFSCLTCHKHSQAEMDEKHREVNGYIYESNACLACHPGGRKGEDD